MNLMQYNIIGEHNNKTDNLILSHKSIRAEEVHKTHISLGISAWIGNAKTTIVSIYIRPRQTYSTLTKHLDKIRDDIKKEGQSGCIIAGDVNATDVDWAPPNETNPELCSSAHGSTQLGDRHYSQIKKVRGKQIATFMRTLKMTCLNSPREDVHTFQTGNGQGSNIDIAYAGNKIVRKLKDLVITDIGSNHKMLIIETKHQEQERNTIKHVNYNKLQDGHFLSMKIEFNAATNNLNQLGINKLRERTDTLTNIILRNLIQIQNAITNFRTPNKTHLPDPRRRHDLNKKASEILRLSQQLKRDRTSRRLKKRIKNIKSKTMREILASIAPMSVTEQEDL
ncbi:Hypothetical predicted protein, partial [Olea europaea subsp. europaea]